MSNIKVGRPESDGLGFVIVKVLVVNSVKGSMRKVTLLREHCHEDDAQRIAQEFFNVNHWVSRNNSWAYFEPEPLPMPTQLTAD